MQERARERKAAARRSRATSAEGGAELQAKIAELSATSAPWPGGSTRSFRPAPVLVPRTYYGCRPTPPDDKVICFFQPKSKFKVRYSTFGFQPDAKVDDGAFFPTSFAILELTPAAERRLVELVKKAVG